MTLPGPECCPRAHIDYHGVISRTFASLKGSTMKLRKPERSSQYTHGLLTLRRFQVRVMPSIQDEGKITANELLTKLALFL